MKLSGFDQTQKKNNGPYAPCGKELSRSVCTWSPLAMKPCRSAINGKSFQLLHLGTRPQTRRVGGNLERKLVAGHEMMSFLLLLVFVFRSCWMAMLNAIGIFFESIFAICLHFVSQMN